jgi:hypothetical protein
MKIKAEKKITLASFRRRVHSSKLLTVFVRFEGTGTLSLEFEESEKDKVELKIGKDLELKVNDLFFGASGAVGVSNGKVQFKLGIEDFDITFNPSLTNPVSFHIPNIKLPVAGKKFKLEQEFPSLGLTGTAQLEFEVVIDVMPNYRQLAKALKPSNVKAAIQVAKNQLYTVAKRGKSVARMVVKAGRAAVYAPFKWLGNKIGRKLAIESLKLGSQSKALLKLAGRLGKLLGAGGIVLETWLIVKSQIPGLLQRQHKIVIDIVNQKFIDSYVSVLAAYTSVEVKLDDAFLDWQSVIERMAEEPPDMYGVVEHLSRTGDVRNPDKNAGKWVDQKVAKGIAYKKEYVVLAEADWQAIYREAYNVYFLFEDAARHASGNRQKASMAAITKAWKLIEIAGYIAAYQDILAFIANTSVYKDDQGNEPTDIWEEWRAVGEFHRAVFGEDVNQRMLQYKSLIDQGSLTISIPPFGDYADWT